MKLLSQLVREIYICQGNKRYLKNLTVATIMVGGCFDTKPSTAQFHSLYLF